MEQWWTLAVDYLTSPQALSALKALVKVLVGLALGRLAGNGLARLFAEDDAQRAMILRRGALYGITGLFAASALMELGFDLSVLLGAAGILTVAIGFASQTSASNVISGLFLLSERPFAVGDIIRVNGTVGEVLSVDLLSVKLRTFDNLFVRIPNETMIKSEVTNLRRFPIRRVDLQIGVAYKEDLEAMREVLMEVADRNPLCLEEPAPLIIFQGYGDSSINHQFSVWAKTEHFLDLRNSIPIEIKEAFDEHGIEIPFPHRTLYTGSETTPFPVQQANGEADSPASPTDSESPQPR
ncbi:mechanosensitive ion channel family protein [Salinibacter altiplanensis]|uniref:mechanosensitive ion channel family protein n=1 Tax=Salinibacter altiplanensis TaxID=1803181 RepID=UPI000C9F30E3|nr:mechanosensitive ion channel family protein [Salinibacter altiplanensis]